MSIRSIVFLLFATTASAILAKPPLEVDFVTSFPVPNSATNQQYVQLGNQELFIFGSGVSSKLYRFDGQTAAAVADPFAGNQPSFQTSAKLAGYLYYQANSSSGTALYRTDGFSTQFVADVNPATGFDQSISNVNSADNYIFWRSPGPNGTELFRTDGTNTTEFDLLPGSMSSNPSAFMRIGNQLLFTAGDSAGNRTLYRIQNGVPQSLGQFGPFNTNIIEVGDSLYWSNANNIYKYDGTAVTSALPPSGLDHLRIDGATPQYLVVSGDKNLVQSTYTWDGTALRQLTADRAPQYLLEYRSADPAAIQPAPTAEYFLDEGLTLYKVGLDDATKVATIPGGSGLTVDWNSVTRNNGQLFVVGQGPQGVELYRLDGSTAARLTDINPSGDSFDTTGYQMIAAGGQLYFRAYNGTSFGLYRTDGTDITRIADTDNFLPGRILNVGDLPFVFFHNLSAQSNQWEIADQNSAADFAAYFGDPSDATGFVLPLKGADYFFSSSGKIFRITAVPEPTSLLLTCAFAAALLSSIRKVRHT